MTSARPAGTRPDITQIFKPPPERQIFNSAMSYCLSTLHQSLKYTEYEKEKKKNTEVTEVWGCVMTRFDALRRAGTRGGAGSQ